jgi:hypothetical protein
MNKATRMWIEENNRAARARQRADERKGKQTAKWHAAPFTLSREGRAFLTANKNNLSGIVSDIRYDYDNAYGEDMLCVRTEYVGLILETLKALGVAQ